MLITFLLEFLPIPACDFFFGYRKEVWLQESRCLRLTESVFMIKLQT